MSIVASDRESVRARSGPLEQPAWQSEVRAAIRDAGELCRRLQLPPELARQARSGAEQFPVFVPPSWLQRIRPGDPDDPLLRQVLPAGGEAHEAIDFTRDPVGDAAAHRAPGLLQKYQARALLIVTGTCAVHCRYCFRRHFPYETTPRRDSAWDPALLEIDSDQSVREVILSGGDPLMLVDQRLRQLAGRIAEIAHVVRLRIHSRLPVVIPSRVTEEMLEWLAGGRLRPVMVIHANHAQELDGDVAAACDRLTSAGVLLLNQTVLLAGVNDSPAAQCDLSERLIDIGVTPYYLHQLDRVAGAAHYLVGESRGRRIIEEMRRRLPGYAVPRYVREEPGAPSKTWLM